MGTSITFKRPDGKEASGYLANAARGNAPCVVVIQEWWGLSEQIKGLCDRFAVAGFDALAPDLYKGKVVPYHDTDAAGKEMNSLDFIDATTQTVRGAAQYLAPTFPRLPARAKLRPSRKDNSRPSAHTMIHPAPARPRDRRRRDRAPACRASCRSGPASRRNAR